MINLHRLHFGRKFLQKTLFDACTNRWLKHTCTLWVTSYECHGISNHRQLKYLLRLTTKKTLKCCITGLLWGESTKTSWFPWKWTSKAERVPMLWTQMKVPANGLSSQMGYPHKWAILTNGLSSQMAYPHKRGYPHKWAFLTNRLSS